MLGYRPLRGLNGQMNMPSKIEKKQAAAKLRKPPRDFSYTQNRELSWLRFDNRVLDEAFDESVPLFERLKFVSIDRVLGKVRRDPHRGALLHQLGHDTGGHRRAGGCPVG